MQQALARQQPLARSRSHVRQIPLQRRYGIQVRDERVPEDIHAGSAAITGPEVLEELSPVLEDLLTGADVPRDVELPAPPAVEPLDEGERGVDQRAVDVAGDHVHDAPPSSGHPAEEEQSTSLAPTDRALLSLDGPMVSDQAWEWMQTLLPSSTGRRGGRWRDHRQVVEAICWKYWTGTPWRQLPARFGPWKTAYERLSRWRADGTWARVLSQAGTDADAARELAWLFAVDTPAVRAPDAPENGAAEAEVSAAA
jgi:putative transposase